MTFVEGHFTNTQLLASMHQHHYNTITASANNH